MFCLNDAVERMLFPNPVIDKDKYPLLNTADQEIMNMEACEKEKGCAGFVYVREWKNSWFLDIYIYDYRLGKKVIRYVIAPGFCMGDEEEQTFLAYMGARDFTAANITFNERVSGTLVDELNEVAPELHLKHYGKTNLDLLHVYFSSHNSGLREKLYKAGLGEIALYFYFFRELNLVTDNIADAFDIPYNMIKKLNSEFGIEEVLRLKETREQAKRLYNSYSKIINDVDKFTPYQYRYLVDCMNQGEPPKKVIVKRFGKFTDDGDLYKEYMSYWENLTNLREYKRIFPKFPHPKNIREAAMLAKAFVKDGNTIDRIIKEQSVELKKKFTYGDENYVIVVPKGLRDLLDEAEAMENCLYTYVFKIVGGETTVVFMRETNRPKTSLITVEIQAGSIVQALRVQNKPIDYPKMQLFLENFASNKNLRYDISRIGNLFRVDEDDPIELPFA